MIHCLIWRNSRPGIVTYVRGVEVDFEQHADLFSALLRLAALQMW